MPGSRVLSLVLLVTALSLAVPGPASAAAAFPRIDASGFQLVQGTTFATYGDRVAHLESGHPQLAAHPLTDVLASVNYPTRALCHDTYLNASLSPAGFCWQSGADDTDNTWIPQGLTGSDDSTAPGVGGRRVVAVDWHYGTPPNGTDVDANKYVRVSFVDTSNGTYRHALLVEPTSDDDFAAVASHGDGLVWSGHRLFLVSSTVIRVFDLNHFWAMDASSATVGLGTDGRYHARYHAWALPMVGSYWYAGGGCAVQTGVKPCFSSVALDHSDGSLVSVEYVAGQSGGRVVRWPVDASTGLLATDGVGDVHATEAFSSPVWAMQGATAYGGYFVIAGTCPEFAGQAGDHPSCLHGGVGGVSTSSLTEAPVNTQNLAYWPDTGALWLVNEQLRERVVVHVPWHTLTGR
ncbi:hypothetical protein [Actinocatenispora rupis]|uniref:Secreted protein n=1 Tax=Actinocatenispora rupis TaxID=519421 RepID=A0A8J3NCS2_9ACTN|nr:hypothetical protein [Actinocatenispora rupis]GID10754.1 hypothetical protein Aru02nite_16430 [Actinocatenispora rupis]